jgi:ribosomal-protein-alanine N-acetyltransferase
MADELPGKIKPKRMLFEELDGARIRLISPRDEYLDDILEYSVMPRFYDFLEYAPFKDKQETRNFLDKIQKRSDGVTGHYWFIYHKEAKKVIGTFGILDIDKRKGSAELGYGLSPVFWGSGLFSEALNLVIDYFFALPWSHRLFVKTAEANTASINAVLKAGFQQEGVFRDYYLNEKTGQRSNAVLLSMLRTDKLNRNTNG